MCEGVCRWGVRGEVRENLTRVSPQSAEGIDRRRGGQE